jgi:ABC-type polysaccharide/polyol phosphate transport system ATPase subunit
VALPTSSEAATPVLSVRHLSKNYRVFSRPHHRVLQYLADRRQSARRFCFEVPAVSEVSFDLGAGETLAIIGRNGSGKSTLLEMMTGTLQPSGGEVVRNGRISALLELGAGFNPDFSGRENFRINAAIFGLTGEQIQAIEPQVEAFAEIGQFIDEPVRTYSSGMYVRLAFATAVHVIPDILIVDEALAVGDVFFQQKCFDYLTNELGGTTKIIVTHDLASAVRLADRCLVMDRGRIVFDGKPLEAVETYTALALSGGARIGSTRAPADSVDADGEPPEAAAPSDDTAVPAMPDADSEDDNALDVDLSRSSNPEAMAVRRFRARCIRDGQTLVLSPAAAIVVPGDELMLEFEVELGVSVDQPVWGYLMRDRVGNALFGQNTAGSGIGVEPMAPGRYAIHLNLLWPEVDHGDYVLTLGVGDGLHPLHHTIVAWTQSIAKFTSAPARAVHGAFNNDLRSFAVDQIEATAGRRR